MNKLLWSILGIGALVVVAMSNSGTTSPGLSAQQCEVGKPASGRFYPKAEGTEFRIGAGHNYAMVVNAAAPQSAGAQYRTVDPDVVLQATCATDDWLQTKIVEADGSPVDWETGWVPKQAVTASMTADQAAGLWWDVDKHPDMIADASSVPARVKKLMHDGALKVLKDNKNCGAIATGYPDDARRGHYIVECSGQGGFQVHFTASDVRKEKSFAPPQPFSGDLANEMCRKSILRAATHPSTVNFHLFGTNEAVDPETGERKILQEFDAKNAFGLELNYVALCVVSTTGKFRLSVQEAA